VNGDEPLEPQEPTGTSAPPPPVPGETIWASEPPISPGSRKPAAYAAVVIGLLAMTAGAVFFVRSLGSTKGSSSPQAAVMQFLDAVSKEDMLGVLETMPSSERTLLTTRLEALTKELGRLGVLRADLDLSDLPGIDVEFADVKLRSEELKEGLAAVEILEGRSTYRVDPATSPMGEFVRKLLPKSAFATVRGSDDLADDDVVLAAVQEGDHWYVSLFYTIAETARRGSNLSFPAAGNGIAAHGATTPQGAVDQFIRAAFALDLRRVIELFPPDEAGALQDYAPLFLSNVETLARDAREHFSAKIRELTLTSRESGGEHQVKVRKFDFSIDVPDAGISIDYDGRCATLEGDFFGTDQPVRQCDGGFGGAVPAPPQVYSDAAFTVVERGGSFYVSPLRTTLDTLIGAFKTMTPQILDDIRETFAQMFAFGEGFEPLPPEAVETLAPRT